MVYICFQKRTVGSIPAELVSHFSIMTEKLRDIRRLRKVTQTEMAKILGISRSSFSKKESGDCRFSVEELGIYASFMGFKLCLVLEL